MKRSAIRFRLGLVVIATLLGPVPAIAQIFFEGFDDVGVESSGGPVNLVTGGWEFRRALDSGVYHDSWRQGPWHAGQPAAWEGTGFLAGLDGVPPFVGGNFVEWLILPPITGQSAGQAFSAWVRGMSSSTFPIAGSVQVRYSPSGGTSTGPNVGSIGDFTELLDENSNGSLNQWEELQANIPGNGRIAIRWAGNLSFSFSGTSVDLLVDSVTISEDSATPPLPQPGQSVHWTTAMSPIHLISQQVVPAGGTLIVDAGVQVFFDFNTPTFGGPEILVAGGALRFEGTDAAPVVLRRGVNTTRVPGVGVGSNLLETLGNSGTVYAVHVDSDVSIGAGQSALLTVRDSAFSRATPIDWFSDIDSQWQTPGVSAHQATLVLENCSFHNAIAEINDSIITVSGCDFDNSRLHVVRFPIAQTVSIDGNAFRNSNVVAPFELDGYDAHLGPNNTFINNYAPISLRGGGLTPDSVVPATGNEHNRIFFAGSANGEIVGPMHLPPMNVPYRQWAGITIGQQFDARINYLPGTTVEMDQGTYISSLGGARAEVRGTPEAPVRFTQAAMGQRWNTFQTSNNPPLIIRNAVFDGGQLGVGGVDTLFSVHDCTFTNNIEGVRSGDYCGANISKSRFTNNDIGIHAIWGGQGPGAEGVFYEYGSTNANAFEGNGVGAVVDFPFANQSWMRNAWWDSPAGPVSPSNPGGSGQSVTAGVDVLPFLTNPVNFDDHPPVVRVKQVAHSRRLRLSTKIILHWDARDDGTIVTQRLEHILVYGFGTTVTVIPQIPAFARSVELTLTNNDYVRQVYRIVTVDDVGQEGYDDFVMEIGEDQALSPVFLTDLSGGYRVGENFDVEVTLISGSVPTELHIDDLLNDIQPRGDLGLLAIFNVMPAVSTDLARFAIIVGGEPIYSSYFSIRPQVGFGDDPPQVAMTAPMAGSSYSGGSIVPIRWTASDDQGLRSFDLQASYDMGESWHLFASGLPGAAREYDWTLPASTGIADVRVRVVARDTRFQVSSDGTHQAFSIQPGDWQPAVLPGDIDADGDVDSNDQLLFTGVLIGSNTDPDQVLRSDLTGDGITNGLDVSPMVKAILGN